MTTDIWNFVGRWNGPFGNTQFWSLNAAPTASQDAIINGGAATTVASSAQAASILLAPYANLYVINAATLSATGLTNFGNVEIGAFGGNGEVTQDPNGNNYTAGGESVTISGTFVNAGSGFLTLGNSNLTASTSLTVGQLTNTGTINLWGNENLSALKQATLVVNSAAPTTLLGKTYIHGDSLIQYASGGIQTIGTGAELQIDGQQSRVSIGAGSTNSALTGLANNLGTFDLEGDWSTGPGGAVVATNTNLFNSGSLQLDTYNADGASQMTIGGTLTNTGAVVVGNSNLSASTTLTLTNLVNYGSINLWGNETLHTSEQATLNILAAAPSIWTGQIFIHGDSDVIFASGGVNSIAAGAEIQIDGQQSRYSIGAGTTNSALAALSTNYGIFDEEGDWSTGPGGATGVTNVDFTNYATFQLDVYNADGASSFTDNGLFTNDDNVQVGNDSLSANATLTVNSLMNNGALYVDSQRTGGVGHAQAAVIVKSAAPSASLGSIRLAGDSLLDYASGAIHSISSGALIELDGDAASLAIASNGQNSALKTLSSNAGTLLLRGASGFGAGVTLTTTTGYANSGLTRIDANGSDGGDKVTFGGALNNSNELDIGNAQLAANTTVNAASLIDTGNLTLQGNAGGPTSASATLAIAGAASAGASGYERIAGNATLSFGAGVGYTSVAATAWLELDGALAGVNLGAAGAHNSGLASLARNNGAFVLRGNSYGQGGAAVTTGVALVNSGTLTVDAYGNDGGSELHVGGALTNYKTLNIGNGLLSASTVVTAASLANYGALTIQGSAGAGSVPQAALNISGASASTVSNAIRIGGNAQLSFGSGSGLTQIGKTGNLELDGAQASVAAGAGGPNSGVSHLSVNNGVLLVRGNSGFGQGGVTFATVGDYSNANLTQIDYFGNDGGSNLSFGGTIFNKATLSIGNVNLAAATTVTAAKLVNSGALTLQGGYYATGPQATLAISGASPTLMAGSLRVAGTATLSFGSGGGLYTISQGGFVELDGAQANIAVGSRANSGLANLSSNSGVLLLRGNSNFGQGGVSVATTGNFVNTGTTEVDIYSGDGGSTFALGGSFNNQGALTIGSGNLSAASTVSAINLFNFAGQVNVVGGGAAATLALSGSALNYAGLFIGAGGVLSAAGTFIQYGGADRIDGALTTNTFTQYSGTTTVNGALNAKTVNVKGGAVVYNSALTAASQTASLTLSNGGDLSLGAGASSSQTFTFQDASGLLELSAPTLFAGNVAGFVAGDVIELMNQSAAASVSYSGGVLSVLDSGSHVLEAFKLGGGAYTTSSFTLTDGASGKLLSV